MNFDSQSASTDSNKANLFNQYFHSVFHDPSSPVMFDECLSSEESLSSIHITIPEVYEALTSLDIEKSCGIDRIAPRVFYNCAGPLCEPLHHLFSIHYFTLKLETP